MPTSYEPEIITRYSDLLTEAGQMLHKFGAIIGHLKVMLNGGKNGYVILSLTSTNHPTVVKGKLKPTTGSIRMRINSIAYNISNDKMSDIFKPLTGKEFVQD